MKFWTRKKKPVARISTDQSRWAVFGDVHANLEALEAVLADINAQGVSQRVCTGDLVGYGANPSKCLHLIRDLNDPVVQGNHDSYAATEASLSEFNLNAMNAILWTREQLTDEEKAWLINLPMQIDCGMWDVKCGMPERTGADHRSVRLVHSSIIEPEKWHYIMKPDKAEAALRTQEPDLVFFGHTHVPTLYSWNPETEEFTSEFPLEEGIHPLPEGWKHLINPGSVGQPRDRDPRASYAMYDPEARTLEIRRIEYNLKKTARKIVEAGLPERNAQRLSKGR